MANFLEFLWGFIVTLTKVLYFWLESIVLAFIPTKFIAKDISGQTVLITGAGSGIGRLLALKFAEHKCHLILWDNNEAGNKETAQAVQKTGAIVQTCTVDVCDREQVYLTAQKVKAEHGPVDILVNNAGIVTGKQFLDCPDSMLAKTVEVNMMAHFWTIKAFLPDMLSRNKGHIVSVASSAGLIGVPRLADYCASKFGVVGFTESLRYELDMTSKTGIHITVVCPYLITTGMFDGCRTRFPWLVNPLHPENAAQEIFSAVLRNQHILIIPRVLSVFVFLKGMLPVKAISVICDFMGVLSMMDTFQGRKRE